MELNTGTCRQTRRRPRKQERIEVLTCRTEVGGCGKAVVVIRELIPQRERRTFGGTMRSKTAVRMVAIHADELLVGERHMPKVAPGTFGKLRRVLEEKCLSARERTA